MTEPARSGNTGNFSRKFLKLLAWSASAIAGLAAAAVLWLLFFFPSEKAARILEARLGERLGTPVRIEHLRVSLLEGLDAGPVRIGPAETGDGRAPWLTLDRLVFRFDLRQVLHGRYVVRALKFENVALLLERSETGWNWQGGGGKKESAPREAAPPRKDGHGLRLEIQEVEIGPLYVRVATPQAEAGVGPLWVFAQGAFEPGGALQGSVRAGRDSGDLAELKLRSPAAGWKAQGSLGGSVEGRIVDGDRFEVGAGFLVSSVQAARAGRPAQPLKDLSLALRAAGSVREGKVDAPSWSLQAGTAARLEGEGHGAWLGNPSGELRLARLSADFAEASRVLAALGIESPVTAGTLSGRNLEARLGGARMVLGGTLRAEAVEFSRGAISAKAVAAGVFFNSLAIGAGGFPLAGTARLEGSWSGLSVGSGLGFPDGKVEGNLLTRPSGPAVFDLTVDSGIAAALPPLAHQGAVSVRATAELDGQSRALRLSRLAARADGAELSAKGAWNFEGKGAESLSAHGRVDIARFLESWGAQSRGMRALAHAGAAGELAVDVSAGREERREKRRLRIGLSSSPSILEGESYGLTGARLAGEFSARLGAAGLERPSGNVEFSAKLLRVPLGGAEKASLRISLAGGVGEGDLAGSVSAHAGRFWYGPREAAVSGARRPQPLDASVRLTATRGRGGLEKIAFDMETGPVLALAAAGTYRPGPKEIALKARARKPWPLSGLLQAVPPAYRPWLREGSPAEGSLSWNLDIEGVLPSGAGELVPFPLSGKAELSWQGIALGLAWPRVALAGFAGELRASTLEAAGRPLQVQGRWTAGSLEAGNFRPDPLGPVEGRVALRTDGSFQWILDELVLHEASLPAALKAKGAWSPLAGPSALWTQATLDVGGGARAATLPAGIESTGAVRAALALSRRGKEPVQMEGDVRFDGLTLRRQDKLLVEGIGGSIPISTALDLEGGLRLVEARAAAGASLPGRLPSLLYGELAVLSPLAEGSALDVARVSLPRIEVRKVRTRARIEGPRVFLDGLSADFIGGSLTGGAWAEIGSPLEAHLTLAARSLNFQKVLPAWRLSKDVAAESKEYLVDGDANLVLRYPPADVSGEFQLTRLGRDVLFALMDWADPAGTNAGMKDARSIFRNYAFVGPKSVRIPMAHGSADFTVHVQFMGDRNALRTLYKGVFYNLVRLPKEFHMQIPLKALLGTVLR